MTADPSEMPLLPMPAVLFPGTFLPVQICEASHRQLLRACAEEGRSLGVMLNTGNAGNGSPMMPRVMGCVASVTLLIDSEDKESLGAVFYGEQRMRVVRYTKQEPHVTAQIELLDEYPGLHAERRTKQASQLFQRYLNLVRQRYHAQVVNVPLPDDPITASYLLAAVLYLPLETKQRWLESASAEMRLQEELAFLTTECDKLTTILALSQHTQRHYATPDSHLFASLVSQN